MGLGGEVRVKALYIYPVKSCRGIAVPHASITPTGILRVSPLPCQLSYVSVFMCN
jgi:hypothetical protein